MENITDKRALDFVNGSARPLCDHWVGQYTAVKQLMTLAAAQDTAALFPADASPVMDGAPDDGRHPVTAEDVLAFLGVAQQIIAFCEQPWDQLGGKRPIDVLAAFAVNPKNPLA